MPNQHPHRRGAHAPAVAILCLYLLLGASGCATAPPAAPAPPAAGPGEVALLAVNDVYRIEGVDGGATGGLARLRTLRTTLERDHPDLLVLHGGDLLFPSLLSRLYTGEQMIDVLNRLDGDGDGFDRRLFVVFGNHEFDRGKSTDAALLDGRVDGSQFTWIASNLAFGRDAAGAPLVGAEHLVPSALVESGGLRVGLFGLTIDSTHPAYVASFADPVATAREQAAALRAAGAEVVVGLTHLDWREDERILRELGDAGPDLIIGGHDHERMAREVGGRWLLKADADARTATVVRLRRRPAGGVDVDHAFHPLTGAEPAADPEVAGVVSAWLRRHERELCAAQGEEDGCLSRALGRTRTPLVGEETAIRGSETSLGNWVADQMVAALAPCGAQAALVNSGSLRLNQDLPAGTEITRRYLEELFGFPAPLLLLRLDGSTLEQMAQHAVAGWPGKGHWLQVSGLAFVHDPERERAERLTLLSPNGPRPIAPDDELLVATTQFLVDPAGGQDGYTMLDPAQVVPCPASGQDLKEVVRRALAAAEPTGIAPLVEGRICRAPASPNCQVAP